MALRFFRRRQKLVIILMVLLMVAFLVPTGIRGLFQRDPGREVVGHVGGEKITAGMLRAASRDLRVLRDWLRLGQFQPPRVGELGFATLLRFAQDHSLSWTLLVHEARQMDLRIDDRQIEEFLFASGLERGSDAYLGLLARLAELGLTETALRQAVGNYLLVTRAFELATLRTWPSLPELRRAYRDLTERVELAMVTFPTEDFLKGLPEPSDQQVREAFEKFRHLIPDHPGNQTNFGFGYRLPNRLNVAYLFISSDHVRQAVQPSEEEMLEYWQRYRGRITKRVPVPTTQATAPATQTTAPATQATAPATQTTAPATQATRPAEPQFRDVPIQRYSEAKPQIREALKEKAAEGKMSELLRRAEELIEKYGTGDEAAYSKTAAAMISPADALLARKVPGLGFRTMPLSALIARLEEITGLRIIYPLGRHGEWFLDGKVEVKIDPQWDKLPLGEVLAKIAAAHDYPKLQWVTCAGFESMIFPAAPVDLVPISSGRTGMVSFEEIVEHELLGSAAMSRDPRRQGQTPASVAATAAEFQGPRLRRVPLIKVGDDFRQAMYVAGLRPGRLLWRLLGAEPAHQPELLSDDIRRQVVDDIKIAEAFGKAQAAAEAMKAKLDAGAELAKLAKDAERELVDTGLFARRTAVFGGMDVSVVAGVGKSSQFIEAAFKLAPEDPEPPHAGRPAAVVPLHRQRNVLLVQRTGYEPAVASEFDQDAPQLAQMLLFQRQREELVFWFNGQAIAQRVGFVEPMPQQ